MTRIQRTLQAAAVMLALLTLPGSAVAAELYVGARVPLIVPLGLGSSVGAGFTPSLQVDLGRGLGLNLSSGFIYCSNDDGEEKDIPVLLGVAYTFHAEQRVRPYLELKAGYTHAIRPDESGHWITLTGGAGVYIRTVRSLELDLGADVVAPDLRGTSRDSIGFMIKLGARYGLI
jgi:hypothetical protein